MIYVLCSGGLGNQMFQYAYKKHLEEKGKEALLDTSYFKHSNVHSGYILGSAFGIDGSDKKDHFNTHWKIRYSMMSKLGLKQMGSVRMERPDSEIDETKIGKNAVLYGFWQGERFFTDVKDKVKQRFKFKNLSAQTVDLGKKMMGEESVAVHIRRGDYLKYSKYVNLSSTKYYNHALNIIRNQHSNPRLYIFSDDIAWCKQSGLFDENVSYIDFNDGVHAYEDMFLMTRCNAIITANSTFSWWGGYLGNHQIVIRPEKFLVNWSAVQDRRLYPQEWISCRIGE